MTWLLAVAVGALLGLTLGALGAGGSILAVPALVYLLGQSPQQATTSSLVIVGATAAVAATQHARRGRVRWRVGAMFAAAGIPASLAGTALNGAVDGAVILIAFAVVMALSAASMLWRTRRGSPRQDASGPPSEAQARDTGSDSGSRVLRIVGAGLLVGFLTGFLGVGGGFVVVPALIAALGMAMPTAVGTSLVIIALNSAVSLAARTGSNAFDWALILPFTLAAVLGSFGGRAVTDRLPARRLTQIFALLLLAVAAYVLLAPS